MLYLRKERTVTVLVTHPADPEAIIIKINMTQTNKGNFLNNLFILVTPFR